MNLVKHYVRIKTIDSKTPVYQVTLNGKTLVGSAPAKTLLIDLYKTHVGDYPKFYKMDPLCRAGFIASELLLKTEKNGCLDNWTNTDDSICKNPKTTKPQNPKIQYGESRGVVLFNAASSLADDRNYQATINNSETAFPSPSLFVYTLPNVLTGEIAIRNHYYGETNFIVLPELDCDVMACAIEMTFSDLSLQSLITGWVDCYSETDYDVLMFIVGRSSIQTLISGGLDSMSSFQNELSQEIKILTSK